MFFVRSPGNRPLLRIGELNRRPGVSDHVLRAWENRYGLLQPVRSPGGLRLSTAAGARLMAGDPVTEAGRAGWSR